MSGKPFVKFVGIWVGALCVGGSGGCGGMVVGWGCWAVGWVDGSFAGNIGCWEGGGGMVRGGLVPPPLVWMVWLGGLLVGFFDRVGLAGHEFGAKLGYCPLSSVKQNQTKGQ